MKCNCGNELNSWAKYCPECGAAVAAENAKHVQTSIKPPPVSRKKSTKSIVIGIISLSLGLISLIWMISDGMNSFNEGTAPLISSEESNIIQNDEKITKAEFNQLKSRMSYEDACKIVGSKGELLSESGIGDSIMQIYVFEGESLGSNANITLQDGKLISKAQFGLK